VLSAFRHWHQHRLRPRRGRKLKGLRRGSLRSLRDYAELPHAETRYADHKARSYDIMVRAEAPISTATYRRASVPADEHRSPPCFADGACSATLRPPLGRLVVSPARRGGSLANSPSVSSRRMDDPGQSRPSRSAGVGRAPRRMEFTQRTVYRPWSETIDPKTLRSRIFRSAGLCWLSSFGTVYLDDALPSKRVAARQRPPLNDREKLLRVTRGTLKGTLHPA
jgi:hypothetical protein